MKRAVVTVLAVVFAFGVVACEPSENHPTTPKAVRTKYIDPESKICSRYIRVNGKRKCKTYKVDDKDYVIVTTDGKQYDVDADEYNSVHVGGRWTPR